ncbi:methyltransferase family protein [Acidihalobacter prosperus]|uniref:Isoprenylcysteine carboxyl methyltransferase n=1 Tax=Acidihalobacter prosperus TaxID=160660 RepID=A0A1A6C4G5_9GAMM|nr:isoprenylcysteine carboxylmethyltransferase family protein [Acidihalobacter prosperus]OBS09453.1 hypothetical protein Thpro_021781 [Acidihalobacter prosperus]
MLKLRFPPPVYAFAAGLVMLGLRHYLPGPVVFPEPLAAWGWAGVAGGGLLTLWALAIFAGVHTTLNPYEPSKASRFVTHGPFRFSRNPMYLGYLTMLLGWAVWLDRLAVFAVPPLFALFITLRQIVPEERALTSLFGEPYVRYRQQVNRWLGG